jgi:hypothetical protein
MSIWPLLEAGEFNTISEGLTEADAAITEGRLAEYISNIVDRVPAKLGTAGRYLAVTRDTALFQAMARATAYGDFIAKAILYDKLTKKDGMSSEAAMTEVSKEYVNYNFNYGRGRTYVDKMGLAWFMAYKLRIMKIALNIARDNPLRALIMSAGVPMLPDVPGVSVGSPLVDNAAGVIIDDRLDYALGYDMLRSAPGLNPWYNLGH